MLKKRNLIFLSLFILGILLITSCLPNLLLTEGILKGQVIIPEGSILTKDLTGQALSDATVNIIDLSSGEIIATTTTDANGYYQVFVPAGGPYLLEAIKDGVKVQQITPQVEAGTEYDLGTADCHTTTVALIAQAMLEAEDYPNDPAAINLVDIAANPDFDDVASIVCSTIQAGEDSTVSAAVLQAVEDFLNPPEPAPSPEPTPSPITINIAAIPGVTVPEVGATPVTTITATAQYTGTVAWTPTDDPFVGSTAYTATITLTPKTGFTLTGVAANFFTVAGTSSPATNVVDSGIVTAVFSETAAAVINIAAISGVTVPVAGENPVTAITATAQYTGTVAWVPTEDPFEGDKVYVATITLTAKTGFTLAGVAANFFTVAEATIVTNTTDSGVITAIFPETRAVGDSYGGGIIAYLLQSGDPGYDPNVYHGLIAATADQSTGIAWSNITDTSVGTTGTALGTGQANTTAIVGQTGCTSGAAKLCDDLTEGSYSDWYLPSRDELNKLCINQVAIGGFNDGSDGLYWSSTEYDANSAYLQVFAIGMQGISGKGDSAKLVRAVRTF